MSRLQPLAIAAEQAGAKFFADHPRSDYASAASVARKSFRSVLEQDSFVAGWNLAYWKRT